jgi:PQQ enzyme-like repeat protein
MVPCAFGRGLQGVWLTRLGSGVFRGKLDGNLVAEDARTGDDLWTFQTGWGISAPPMTCSIDGNQYVTVAAGGNRGGVTTLEGDAVWTFSLNGTVGPVAAPRQPDSKVTLAGAQRRSATRSPTLAPSATIGASTARSIRRTTSSTRCVFRFRLEPRSPGRTAARCFTRRRLRTAAGTLVTLPRASQRRSRSIKQVPGSTTARRIHGCSAR